MIPQENITIRQKFVSLQKKSVCAPLNTDYAVYETLSLGQFARPPFSPDGWL